MSQVADPAETGVIALIALGSNGISPWGDAAETVQKAMVILSKKVGHLAGESPLYATPAFPAGAGPDFVNAAIRVTTALSAADLLTALHAVEAEAARERTVRWGQRTLDLDLIVHGVPPPPDLRAHCPSSGAHGYLHHIAAPDQLILPHPRLQDRSFVLVPLADVAPDWVHPVLGQSVVQMRDARPSAEIASVRLL
mgnify:CR=1 FL=1